MAVSVVQKSFAIHRRLITGLKTYYRYQPAGHLTWSRVFRGRGRDYFDTESHAECINYHYTYCTAFNLIIDSGSDNVFLLHDFTSFQLM